MLRLFFSINQFSSEVNWTNVLDFNTYWYDCRLSCNIKIISTFNLNWSETSLKEQLVLYTVLTFDGNGFIQKKKQIMLHIIEYFIEHFAPRMIINF